jgi:DNA-directed RNA polymerase specialized sigma24 family protein
MSEPIRIPRHLQQAITACSRTAHTKLLEKMRSKRRAVISELRGYGLSDREIGNLLGVTAQCVWQQCPRKVAT